MHLYLKISLIIATMLLRDESITVAQRLITGFDALTDSYSVIGRSPPMLAHNT